MAQPTVIPVRRHVSRQPAGAVADVDECVNKEKAHRKAQPVARLALEHDAAEADEDDAERGVEVAPLASSGRAVASPIEIPPTPATKMPANRASRNSPTSRSGKRGSVRAICHDIIVTALAESTAARSTSQTVSLKDSHYTCPPR